MNNPIPLDLAKRVWRDYCIATDLDIAADMQAALAAHLPELAALPAIRDLVLADRREADVEVIRRWADINNVTMGTAHPALLAAALSDATNGGHWEEGDEAYNRAMKAGFPHRIECVVNGTVGSTRTLYGWVPADPDAALLAIVDADTLARLREVAEVTAR